MEGKGRKKKRRQKEKEGRESRRGIREEGVKGGREKEEPGKEKEKEKEEEVSEVIASAHVFLFNDPPLATNFVFLSNVRGLFSKF